jgi:hypothetical protein
MKQMDFLFRLGPIPKTSYEYANIPKSEKTIPKPIHFWFHAFQIRAIKHEIKCCILLRWEQHESLPPHMFSELSPTTPGRTRG